MNANEMLFGGQAFKWIDEVAYLSPPPDLHTNKYLLLTLKQ